MPRDTTDTVLPTTASSSSDSLSWLAHARRFCRFVGPTWLIAVTFTDPGGIVAALQQGSETKFVLLWISWWSIVFGYFFQILAGRVGIASGKSLGTLCRERYGDGLVKYIILLFMMGATFGDDIQACVGATIALQIMTGLPFWACVLLTLAVSLFLTLAYYWDATKLEICIGLMLLGMLVLVCINAGEGHANVPDILYGWVVPRIPSGQVQTVVGSVGGVLTPEALFLGSAMVLNRSVNRRDRKDVKRCMWYSTVELIIGMLVAYFVYLAVTITFANGFYSPECAAQGLAYLPAEGQCDEIGLADGPEALQSLYGAAAKWIFATVLLLSGITSMVSGTLAAQATWEGLTGSKVAFWKVVTVTRSIVLVPTLVVALTEGNHDVTYTIINDWVNIYMALSMPMAVIPCIDIAASKVLMKEYAIRPFRIACSIFAVLLLLGINFYLMAEFLFTPVTFGSAGDFPTSSTFYAGVGACALAYGYWLWRLSRPGLEDLLWWFRANYLPARFQPTVPEPPSLESSSSDFSKGCPVCCNIAKDVSGEF